MGGQRITDFTTARCRVLWAMGWSKAEIARELGISTIAVRQRVVDLEHGCLSNGEKPEVSASERKKRSMPRRSHISVKRKLTDEQVAEIRNDTRSSRQLAEVYGVAKTTINRIRSGECYRRS